VSEAIDQLSDGILTSACDIMAFTNANPAVNVSNDFSALSVKEAVLSELFFAEAVLSLELSALGLVLSVLLLNYDLLILLVELELLFEILFSLLFLNQRSLGLFTSLF